MNTNNRRVGHSQADTQERIWQELEREVHKHGAFLAAARRSSEPYGKQVGETGIAFYIEIVNREGDAVAVAERWDAWCAGTHLSRSGAAEGINTVLGCSELRAFRQLCERKRNQRHVLVVEVAGSVLSPFLTTYRNRGAAERALGAFQEAANDWPHIMSMTDDKGVTHSFRNKDGRARVLPYRLVHGLPPQEAHQAPRPSRSRLVGFAIVAALLGAICVYLIAYGDYFGAVLTGMTAAGFAALLNAMRQPPYKARPGAVSMAVGMIVATCVVLAIRGTLILTNA